MCHVTRHGEQRAIERLGLKKKSVQRMAERALDKGIRHSDTKSSLNRYLTKIYLNYEKANNIRIYGQGIYIFNDEILLTVYDLPNKYKDIHKFLKK